MKSSKEKYIFKINAKCEYVTIVHFMQAATIFERKVGSLVKCIY